MNPEMPHSRPPWHVGFGFLVACSVFVFGVLAVKHSFRPPAIDADHAGVRAKALAELRLEESNRLDNMGWIDRQRGIVRLPISIAMQIAVREWQEPAAARSNLIARVEKATAPLPKPAEKPNPFE